MSSIESGQLAKGGIKQSVSVSTGRAGVLSKVLHCPVYRYKFFKMFSRPAKPGAALQIPPSLIHLFINSSFSPHSCTASPRPTVWDRSSSYKEDYVIMIKNCLNLKEHQYRNTGSKSTAFSVKGRLCLLVELHLHPAQHAWSKVTIHWSFQS